MLQKQTTSTRFFRTKLTKALALVAGIIVLYIVAALTLGYDLTSFGAISQGFAWLFHYFMPTGNVLQFLGAIVTQIFRTFLIAVCATTVASVFAIVLALVGAKNAGLIPVIGIFIKGLASFLRNIPLAAWALILVFSFKQNELTGFLALFFMSLGFLTRAFIETIEDYGTDTIKALEATGATYPQIVCQAILPALAVPLCEWVLYMIENNIRDAVLVGLITGSGIGFLFDLYFKSLRYNAAGLVVLGVVVLVIAWEILSIQLKKRIEHHAKD
ncbi:MAG: ABC transporter permease subunit [Lactobacillus sp.]|jgi:phosphonate transport system permease protein|nr:ABC transporter permease subunit [Lactobacillus sp.]